MPSHLYFRPIQSQDFRIYLRNMPQHYLHEKKSEFKTFFREHSVEADFKDIVENVFKF